MSEQNKNTRKTPRSDGNASPDVKAGDRLLCGVSHFQNHMHGRCPSMNLPTISSLLFPRYYTVYISGEALFNLYYLLSFFTSHSTVYISGKPSKQQACQLILSHRPLVNESSSADLSPLNPDYRCGIQMLHEGITSRYELIVISCLGWGASCFGHRCLVVFSPFCASSTCCRSLRSATVGFGRL